MADARNNFAQPEEESPFGRHLKEVTRYLNIGIPSFTGTYTATLPEEEHWMILVQVPGRTFTPNVLPCQHIPCADLFLGCNVLCYRLFRQRVRRHRSFFMHSAMPLELMDSLYLPSLPLLSYLDGLKTLDVISVWLLLCYKSFEYCVCQHYRSRDDTEAQRLDRLRSGRYKMVSEHTLSVGHDH